MAENTRPNSVPGLPDYQIAANMMADFRRFQPFDSQESHRQAAQIDSQLAEACKRGELEIVSEIFRTIRNSDDAIINRPSAWMWRNVAGKFFQNALENDHWDVIEYLARQPEIDIMPPTQAAVGEWSLPKAVARRAVTTNDTTQLDKLIEFGWDINQCLGHKGDYWPSTTPPVLSTVFDNKIIVSWFLNHGADANASCDIGMTPMVIAAREAPLPILDLLAERGGKIGGTDLVAQAALGDSWGKPDRLVVIEYLLERGAPIDAMAASTWKPQRQFKEMFEQWGEDYTMRTYSGGQTALHIAHFSGNQRLVTFLLEKGADSSIEPLRMERMQGPSISSTA